MILRGYRLMSKQIEKVLLPKLRFSEFQKNSNWSYMYGNMIFKQISNKKHKSDLPILAITQEYGAIPRDCIDYTVSVTEQSIQSYKIVDIGDFIISLRSFQGGIEYSNYKGICSPAYIILRKKINIVEQFYKYYFKTNLFIRGLNKNIEGIRDGKMVSYKQFSELLLPITATEEQQKIADCLSSVDEYIVTQSQKIESLQGHKKGLMQQLFPVEGETVPKIRFNEFKNVGVWENKKLGNIATFHKGRGISKADITSQGNTLCIRYGELYTHYNETIDSVFSRTNVSPSELFLSRKNDVIIPSSGETKWDIARASCVMLDGIALGSDLNVIRFNENGVFISYYLSGAKKLEISKIAQGDTVVHLYSSQLKLLELLLPAKSEEQQKIADCLTSLDELITAETQKLEVLKTHKKGLMQQLFPVIEES